MIATVHYQIASYKGSVTVNCDPDDDNGAVIARAKATLRRRPGGIPYPGGPCYESWRVGERSDEESA